MLNILVHEPDDEAKKLAFKKALNDLKTLDIGGKNGPR